MIDPNFNQLLIGRRHAIPAAREVVGRTRGLAICWPSSRFAPPAASYAWHIEGVQYRAFMARILAANRQPRPERPKPRRAFYISTTEMAARLYSAKVNVCSSCSTVLIA